MDHKNTQEQYQIALLEQIYDKLQKVYSQQVDGECYLDSADIQQTFNISARTLRRMRKNNEIPYAKLGKKIYYPKQKIEQLLQDNMSDRPSKP